MQVDFFFQKVDEIMPGVALVSLMHKRQFQMGEDYFNFAECFARLKAGPEKQSAEDAELNERIKTNFKK